MIVLRIIIVFEIFIFLDFYVIIYFIMLLKNIKINGSNFFIVWILSSNHDDDVIVTDEGVLTHGEAGLHGSVVHHVAGLSKGCVYSSLTLVLAICEGSHNSPQNKFSSFLTLYIAPHIPKASGICEKKFRRFSFRNL